MIFPIELLQPAARNSDTFPQSQEAGTTLETPSSLTDSFGYFMEEENLKSTYFLVLLLEIMTSPRSPMEGSTGATNQRTMLSGCIFVMQRKYLHIDKHPLVPTCLNRHRSIEMLQIL